jgi:lipopolysaccharide biosynthesis protein
MSYTDSAMIKIIAFYLPQFHSIPQNDSWWGKGFTEWVNMKKAKPLFFNHYQPREPLNDNYYNLLDANTLKWQAELANKYNLYGFCYYHYWFGGTKILEKPAEILLQNCDIKTRYCFSWANESWVRTWDGRGKDVLMQQDYGSKSDWLEHFEYLLPFFKDERYIRFDNLPVFLIYRASDFDKFDEMFEYWDELCKKNDIPGLYIIETFNAFGNEIVLKNSKAAIEFEPSFTRAYGLPKGYRYLKHKVSKIFKGIKFDLYDTLWEKIIKKRPLYPTRKMIPGAFVDWDNSPRRSTGAAICLNATPAKFKKYLGSQIKNAINNYKSDYVFLNAWNEWAEGAYLEPDKKFGYQYLEALKDAVDENS